MKRPKINENESGVGLFIKYYDNKLDNIEAFT